LSPEALAKGDPDGDDGRGGNKRKFMKLPELPELLKAGVHFGHQKSKRYPTMKPYVFGTRGGIDIIDLDKTRAQMQAAYDFIKGIAASGGTILFVGTKRQAKPIVAAAADACGMPYVTERWLGGTFTNFRAIMQMTQKLTRIEQQQASGEINRYTKKEQTVLQKEAAKLQSIVGSLKLLRALPQAIYVVDVKREGTAVAEANKLRVPVVAACDSNIDSRQVQWPIAGNDDASKSIELVANFIAQAVSDGKANPVVAPTPVVPAV